MSADLLTSHQVRCLGDKCLITAALYLLDK